MAGRCPEGHSPGRRGSRAERKRRAPARGSRSTCKGTGLRIRGSPSGRRCCWVLAGGASSPLCFQRQQHFDPSCSHHVAKASGFLSLSCKASATQAASLGTADTSGCLAKKHFFPLLPLSERTRNRLPPLTALRRIPRPSAPGLVSSHLAKEAFAAVVCWTRLGTHTLRPCLLGLGKQCAFATQRSSVFLSSSEACSLHASLENCWEDATRDDISAQLAVL